MTLSIKLEGQIGQTNVRGQKETVETSEILKSLVTATVLMTYCTLRTDRYISFYPLVGHSFLKGKKRQEVEVRDIRRGRASWNYYTILWSNPKEVFPDSALVHSNASDQ